MTGQQYDGPWLVRLAMGAPVERAIEPLVARTHEELAQILSGLLAAVSLLGAGERLTITVEPGGER